MDWNKHGLNSKLVLNVTNTLKNNYNFANTYIKKALTSCCILTILKGIDVHLPLLSKLAGCPSSLL